MTKIDQCPDRFVRDHRNCDRCDREMVQQHGYDSVAKIIGPERANKALESIANEGVIS